MALRKVLMVATLVLVNPLLQQPLTAVDVQHAECTVSMVLRRAQMVAIYALATMPHLLQQIVTIDPCAECTVSMVLRKA
jgi:hypothetical protein